MIEADTTGESSLSKKAGLRDEELVDLSRWTEVSMKSYGISSVRVMEKGRYVAVESGHGR